MKHYKEHYASMDDLYKEAANLINKSEKLSYAKDIINTLLLNERNSPVLIFQAGNIQMKRKYYPLAEVFFLKALELKPDFPECFLNLGYIYKEMEMIDEARDMFERGLDMIEKLGRDDSEKALYLHNYASIFVACGNPQKAIDTVDKVLSLDPSKVDARWNRGLAYLELGNYEKGFEDYEYGNRIETTKNRNYSKDSITPFWDGTPGKTVVVYGEQGIGDELMFATMIPDIMKDCNVILDGHPRLADLFRDSFPGLPVFGTRKIPSCIWSQFYTVDAKASIATLGKFYRKKEEDFPKTPYLKADPKLVEKYKIKLEEMGPKKKIGISWKGGTSNTNKSKRKIKLDLLLPLLELEDQVDFISLQYHEDSPLFLKNLKEKHNRTIHHWQDVLDDYDETAGLISNLDLIISVPQSVVHLAGSIGVPTWQMCPKKALWQMGPYGKDMPWYGCVKNYWQDETETWEPVIKRVKEDLCNYLQMNTKS